MGGTDSTNIIHTRGLLWHKKRHSFFYKLKKNLTGKTVVDGLDVVVIYKTKLSVENKMLVRKTNVRCPRTHILCPLFTGATIYPNKVTKKLTISNYFVEDQIAHGKDNTRRAATINTATQRKKKAALLATSQVVPQPACRAQA
jgi:hypothetical protein